MADTTGGGSGAGAGCDPRPPPRWPGCPGCGARRRRLAAALSLHRNRQLSEHGDRPDSQDDG